MAFPDSVGIEKCPGPGLETRYLEIKSQEPNENTDLQNEPKDDGSLGAEGAMALPDSAEIEMSPELGLEIRNLEIEGPEPNENTDLQNEPREGGSPGTEGAMALPLVSLKKKSILINTEIIEKDPEPERAWRSSGSSTSPNFAEILRTEAESEVFSLLPIQKFGPYAPPFEPNNGEISRNSSSSSHSFEPNSGENSRNSSSLSHSSSIRYIGYYSSRQSHYI